MEVYTNTDSKKIYLSFPVKEGFISKIIKFRTLSDVYHVEFLIYLSGNWYVISADPTEGFVITKEVRDLDKYLESHRIILVPLNKEDVDRVLDYLAGTVGKPYDYVGIAEISVNKSSSVKDYWYCSELCTAALQVANIMLHLDPGKTSPGDLKIAILSFNEGLSYSNQKRS
ncbi:MAG: hypothetical protein ACUVQP_00010 [Bacteroidales bacterium]